MTPGLYFVSGWAMPSGFWDRVRALLPPELLDGATVDAAYDSDRPVLAVGHSLGVMRLLAAPGLRLAGLLSINGFSRFAQAPDYPAGIDTRILERMAQRLQRQPAATVADFHVRCGLMLSGPEPSPADLPGLVAGLRLLQDGDGRAALAASTGPVLALAGEHDAIAPPALSLACFSALAPLADGQPGLRWVEQGGHVLPDTHPQVCADAIFELLALTR